MKTDDKLRDTLQEWLLSERQYRAGADLIRSRFVVIDRNDQPKAGPDPEVGGSTATLWAEHPEADGTWWDPSKISPEFMRARALEILALVEHHAANPPIDEKAKRALQQAVEDVGGHLDSYQAQALIADGWKREVSS